MCVKNNDDFGYDFGIHKTKNTQQFKLFTLTPCEYSRNKNGEASPAPSP